MSTAASKRGRRPVSAMHDPAAAAAPADPTAATDPTAAADPTAASNSRRGRHITPQPPAPVAPSAAAAAAAASADDDGAAYEARTAARISRTGIVERSAAAAVISAACQRHLSLKPRPPSTLEPLPPHHRRQGGFRNPWDSAFKDGGLRSRGGSGGRTFFHKVAKDRRPPDEELATMLLLATTPDFDQADDELEKDEEALVSFWIGHCTFLLRATGLTVLTDPVWSLRLGPLGPKRLVPPACSIDALPKTIDAVILSSACYDHYDKNAVAALVSRVTVWLVPLGLKQVLVSAGVPDDKVIELDWWEESVVKGYTFICTPAQHYSIRDGALWCSWVVNAEHHHFFYCGGTGYRAIDSSVGDNGAYISRYSIRSNTAYPNCPAFQEINRRYGPCDTAFLPIGGSKPRVLMSGVQGDARDMVCVHRDLDAKRSVVHRWGTFACNDEGMLDAVRLLENVLARGPVPEREISYLRHGQMHVT